MARNVGILDSHQRASDRPISYVSKSHAACLVRRQVADWLVKNYLIRQRGEHRPADVREEVKPTVTYIPVILPPVEGPGLIFKPSEMMTKSRLQSQVPQLHYLPRGEQEANLLG